MYFNVSEIAKNYQDHSSYVALSDVGFYGASLEYGFDPVIGKTITYSLGYFGIFNMIVQVCGIVITPVQAPSHAMTSML